MINSVNNKSARFIAFEVLYDIFNKNAYANLKLQHSFNTYHPSIPDRRLITDIVYGVLRHYYSLLWLEGMLAKRPVKKIHPSAQIIIAIGLYQLIFLDRIPESAAVNESVKIAKKAAHRGIAGFVNAILRSFLRQKEIYLNNLHKKSDTMPSLRWNQPTWIISHFKKSYGQKNTEAILREFNQISSLVVRINTLKTNRTAFLALLDELHIEWENIEGYPMAVSVLKGADTIFNRVIPLGLAYVQSLSSMLPPLVLSPIPGSHVLDMCAAPGGKTTELAAIMKNQGHITAWDLYPHKIQLIKNNAKNLNASIISSKTADARAAVLESNKKADYVLLDAPCSGLGVLGHKLEMRFRRKKEELSQFPAMQKTLLHHASDLLKNDGILVYSTCTLNPDENEKMISSFLNTHPNFEPVDFSLPQLGNSCNGMMTVFPNQMHSDGFFLAKLKKTSL